MRAISDAARRSKGRPPSTMPATASWPSIAASARGLVTYLGTDEIWRWRNPYGSYDYDLFWSHLVRYLGEARLLGTQKQVALVSDKQVYAPGEKATLRLDILDQALLQQLTGERVSATVIDPDKVKQVIPLERNPAGQPFYQGVYQARRIGPNLAQARHSLSTGDTEAKDLFDISASFKVEMVPLESLDTRADLEGMEQLARITGMAPWPRPSHAWTRSALLKLAASPLPTETLKIATEQVHEIWDNGFALALVLALLGPLEMESPQALGGAVMTNVSTNLGRNTSFEVMTNLGRNTSFEVMTNLGRNTSFDVAPLHFAPKVPQQESPGHRPGLGNRRRESPVRAKQEAGARRFVLPFQGDGFLTRPHPGRCPRCSTQLSGSLGSRVGR